MNGILAPRRLLGLLLFAFVAVSAAYSDNAFKLRSRFPPPATRVVQGAGPAGPTASAEPGVAATGGEVRRSQPWWQHVSTVSGVGSTTRIVNIASHAIQWRVNWRCERGEFAIQPETTSGSKIGHLLAETADCPQQDQGYSIQTGSLRLAISATGPWRATIEQQVDVPLIEPPARGMSPANLIARGRFYGVDRSGEGTIKIYRLPQGRLTARLEDFYVTPNVDLEIRLSALPRPRNTKEVANAPFEDVVFLKATVGSMNYDFPSAVDLSRFRSVVIWCEPLSQAYSAATLKF